MTNKFIINEEEKSEILKKHTDFKKVLKEELSNLNRGLVSEQFNTGVVKDPLLSAAEKANCISNGKQIQLQGKPPGYFKVATVDRKGRYSIGDKLVIYNDYTYEVFPKDGSTRKKFTWSCPQINQDTEAQAAAAKKAEEDKKAAEQSSLTTRQQAFIKTYTDQGYVVNPEQIDFRTKKLKRVQPGEIPELESLFPKSLFPKGLNIYQDLTTISGSTDTAFTERAASMSKDVNTCKQLVEKFWKYYQEGEEGDLQDTLFLKLRTDVQSCLKWYPKWDGLEGGTLGIGTGQNHLNNIIDVLTGKKTEYKGSQIPSRTTGYLLTPGRKSR
jgi:hypothetical protein